MQKRNIKRLKGLVFERLLHKHHPSRSDKELLQIYTVPFPVYFPSCGTLNSLSTPSRLRTKYSPSTLRGSPSKDTGGLRAIEKNYYKRLKDQGNKVNDSNQAVSHRVIGIISHLVIWNRLALLHQIGVIVLSHLHFLISIVWLVGHLGCGITLERLTLDQVVGV